LLGKHQLQLEIDVFSAQNLSKPVSPQEIGNSFFWIKAILKNVRCAIKISYGDREFAVNTQLKLEAGDFFSLWEWNEVLGLSEPVRSSVAWLVEMEQIPTVVSDVLAALEYSLPLILNSDKAIQAQLNERREHRYQQAFRSEQEADYQRTSALASEKFRSGNYSETVKLLENVPVSLSKSDTMKLSYSRKQIVLKNVV